MKLKTGDLFLYFILHEMNRCPFLALSKYYRFFSIYTNQSTTSDCLGFGVWKTQFQIWLSTKWIMLNLCNRIDRNRLSLRNECKTILFQQLLPFRIDCIVIFTCCKKLTVKILALVKTHQVQTTSTLSNVVHSSSKRRYMTLNQLTNMKFHLIDLDRN